MFFVITISSDVAVADPDGSDSSRLYPSERYKPEHYALRVNLIKYPQNFCSTRIKKFSLQKNLEGSRGPNSTVALQMMFVMRLSGTDSIVLKSPAALLLKFHRRSNSNR